MSHSEPHVIPADLLLDCFWRLDLDLVIREASPAAEAMFGIPVAALVGSPLADHTHPDDLARLRERLKRALGYRDRTRAFLHQTRIQHADGRLVPVEIHSRLLLAGDGEPTDIIGLARDISGREDARQQAQRLEEARRRERSFRAVEGLSRTVYPAFRDLLTSLQSEGSSATEPAHSATMDSARLQLSRLEILAGERTLATRATLLDPLVSNRLESLRVSLPANIALAFHGGAAGASCQLDRELLTSALASLVARAAAVMGDGGLIKVTTTLMDEVEDSEEVLPTARPDGWVKLVVADRGPGLDCESRESLLDPGAGEEYDLDLTAAIVRQHGGRMEITSRLDQGTSLALILPYHRGHVTADEDGRDRGRIMLVDDDAELRRYVERVLGSAGYEVISCADGVEALAQVAGDDTLRAVVLDWALPGLDGRRVREQLQGRQHRLPVLVISGHDRDESVALGSVDADTPWLCKPFTPSALLQALTTLLDQSARAHES